MFTQLSKGTNVLSNYEHFSKKTGLGRVALVACFLAFTGGIHFMLFTTSFMSGNYYIFQWSFYIMALVAFHLLEFFLTALYNPRTCTADSFLVNHSRAYTIAALASWFEFWFETYCFPSLKGNLWNICIGGFMVVFGQCCRTLAMHTCGVHFHHIVQVQRSKTHQLVTDGLYSIFRHPSYFGWFWFSIGTQILLGNPICIVAYALASWQFFKDRIPFEEMALENMYGKKYEDYKKKTIIGIPFI
jgi:protein-S-isoprenylcysteine O-methyltransferase